MKAIKSTEPAYLTGHARHAVTVQELATMSTPSGGEFFVVKRTVKCLPGGIHYRYTYLAPEGEVIDFGDLMAGTDVDWNDDSAILELERLYSQFYVD